MAVIGVIDIAVKASTDQYIAGMGKASTATKGFAANVEASAGAGLSTLGDRLAALGPKAKSAIGDLGGIAKQLGQIGLVAGGAAAAGLVALTLSSLTAADAQNDLAQSLGVSAGSMAAFQHAVKLTGGDIAALPPVLAKLNDTLGSAATDATPAGLALRRLGLDAKTLAAAGPLEAIKSIADRLNKIANPALRAAEATEIFGKGAKELANTIAAGSGEINRLMADAKRLGLVLSAEDYEAIGKANDQIDRAYAAITGVGNQLAVAVAPYIEAAGAKFVEFATAGGGASATVAKGMGFILDAIGFVANAIQVVKIAFHGFQVLITSGLALAAKAAGLFSSTMAEVGKDLDRLAGEQAADLAKELKQPWTSDAAKSFFADIGKASTTAAETVKKSSDVMADALAKTLGKVRELESGLKDQIATYGMTTAEVEVYKLAQAGASATDLARVSALSAELKALEKTKEETKKFAEDGKKAYEDSLTPLEKFLTESDKLQTLYEKGKIDATTLARGVDKLTKESGLKDTGKRAAALELGSQERTAILANRGRGESSSVEEAQKKTELNTANTAKILNDTLTFFRTEVAQGRAAVAPVGI